ncbi:exodeoxyribonuclease III [archaeon CG10_big_fil_rev_8_21_14_0_10_43_11]|nr:MAG: exodeoxyribonuclease III [archaeon CG10_big_fil_rev_8_21_14_0_10_43_11]
MKLLSWNVNGIRSALKKGFLASIQKHDPDVVCLQETKTDKTELLLPGYHQFWNAAHKKGYSGTAVFTKIKPRVVFYDIPNHTEEGRVITLEFDDFFLVNVYTPNAKRGLLRITYRLKWDADFRAYVKELTQKKQVVICGDLNVAHKAIDLANPQANRRNAGFSDEERESFQKLLNAGFVDTFRMFNQEPNNYTWWTYRFNARERNIGWRIDYFLVNTLFEKRVKSAGILNNVTGSDHCPVTIELKKP